MERNIKLSCACFLSEGKYVKSKEMIFCLLLNELSAELFHNVTKDVVHRIIFSPTSSASHNKLPKWKIEPPANIRSEIFSAFFS